MFCLIEYVHLTKRFQNRWALLEDNKKWSIMYNKDRYVMWSFTNVGLTFELEGEST